MRRWMLAGALVACGGGDDTGDVPGVTTTCDDYGVVPLPTLSADDWPEGFRESLTRFRDLAGRYEVTDCNDDAKVHDFKVEIYSEEEITIVTDWVSESLSCGCPEDPDFPADEAMRPAAFNPRIQIHFETTGIDPGYDGRSFEFGGTFFGPEQGIAYRACHTDFIDPFLESEWAKASFVWRVDHEGDISSTIWFQSNVLDGPEGFCEMNDWTWVGPNQ